MWQPLFASIRASPLLAWKRTPTVETAWIGRRRGNGAGLAVHGIYTPAATTVP